VVDDRVLAGISECPRAKSLKRRMAEDVNVQRQEGVLCLVVGRWCLGKKTPWRKATGDHLHYYPKC
jgi:hypothetical protein